MQLSRALHRRRGPALSITLARLGASLLLAAFAVLPAHAGGWADTATKALLQKDLTGAAALPGPQQLHVVVALNPSDKSGLDELVAGISRPGSPLFGHTITAQQFLDRYAPTAAQAQAVVAYLSSQGFSNIELSDNRLSVSATAGAADVQRAFNTQLVSFALGGRSVFANRTPAQVPAELQGIVAAVLGLHNLTVTQTLLAQNEASGRVIPHAITATGTPQLAPELNAAAFRIAYNAPGTVSGSRTAIGIVTEGDLSQVLLDLRQYEKENTLPQVPYQVVTTGPASTDTSGIDEWDLDSQSSSGIADNLKQITFYNTASLGDADLIPDYEKIVSQNTVKAVNMSFGGCETLEYLSGGMLTADIAFEQGVAEGITFFASTGDAGAACGLLINLGLPDTGLIGVVEYPSSSPYVVAVGGTTLFIDSSNNYIDEISWDAGGGGNSLWETAQPWQNGVVPLGNSTTALRGTPDIAMDADNNLSPALIVVNGADTGVGGTSLSSPLSVGSWARMQSAHDNCYGFAAPIFYSFISSYLKAAKDFHDITIGTNGLYFATTGWDYTTGIGSIDITAVEKDLPACPTT